MPQGLFKFITHTCKCQECWFLQCVNSYSAMVKVVLCYLCRCFLLSLSLGLLMTLDYVFGFMKHVKDIDTFYLEKF